MCSYAADALSSLADDACFFHVLEHSSSKFTCTRPPTRKLITCPRSPVARGHLTPSSRTSAERRHALKPISPLSNRCANAAALGRRANICAFRRPKTLHSYALTISDVGLSLAIDLLLSSRYIVVNRYSYVSVYISLSCCAPRLCHIRTNRVPLRSVYRAPCPPPTQRRGPRSNATQSAATC